MNLSQSAPLLRWCGGAAARGAVRASAACGRSGSKSTVESSSGWVPQSSAFAEPIAVAATKAMIAKIIFEEEEEEEEEEEVVVVAVQREGKHEIGKFL